MVGRFVYFRDFNGKVRMGQVLEDLGEKYPNAEDYWYRGRYNLAFQTEDGDWSGRAYSFEAIGLVDALVAIRG